MPIKDEKGVYEMYYDFAEPINKMVSHRVLASNRGEKEEILKFSIGKSEVKKKSLNISLWTSISTDYRAVTGEFALAGLQR